MFCIGNISPHSLNKRGFHIDIHVDIITYCACRAVNIFGTSLEAKPGMHFTIATLITKCVLASNGQFNSRQSS